MSELIIEILEIDNIEKHPQADRLDIVNIKGWQCVVQRGLFNKNDLILYIPIDSVLPEELESKIFGKDSKIKLHKHRVQTIKLRGIISQGIVIKPEIIGLFFYKKGKNYAKELKIEKYEPLEELPNVYGICNKIKKMYINNNFKKYTDIKNIKNYPQVFEDGKQVYISEKIHGCLKSRTNIMLINGDRKDIGSIVREKYEGYVLGMDEEGNLVPSKILNWFNNGIEKEWLKIKISSKKHGNYYKIIEATENHKFYNIDKQIYIEASKLKKGDRVYLLNSDFEITYQQEQVLIGKMLGDGSYDRRHRHISFGQKKEHEEYLNYINFINLGKNKELQLIESSVIEISKFIESNIKYDIETETHNFFANGILVHNSSFRCGWVLNEANTIWKKVKKFFGLLPKWGFIVGSRNVQLTYGNKDKTFYKENVYTKTAEVLDLKSKLKFGEVLYGEVVGCFHYNTPILLSTGKNEKIGLLYNKFKNGEDIFVNSYNFEKEKTELKKVVGFTKNKAKKEDWITFEYKRRKRGGRACHIVTTKNHLFFTKYFKEIEADKLQIGDTIYLPSNKTLSFTQEQMILGSILGDASFSNNIYLVAHSEKQIEYLKFKQAILENFTIREFETISGHGSKMLGFSTCSLYDKITYDIKNILYTNNIKEPTKEYLEKLSPIAWAFWYMDDGSLHKTDGKQPISTISTLGFSKKSVDVIVEYFNIKSIFCFKIPIIQSSNGNKQYKLQFSAEGTKRFQALIAPYIHKSMSYKLLDCYKNIINSIDLKSIIKQDFGLIETIITSKNSGSFFKDTNCSKYDLEVEGNHNYFANNVLVHNSGIQKGYNYACSPGITAFYAYDVMIDNKWLDYEDFKNFCEERGIRPVPLLYIGPYSKEVIEEHTKGVSVIDPNGTPIREGCVVKPVIESISPYVGRKVLKSVSEEFLLLKNGSDFH